MPNGRLTSIATVATRMLRRTAVHSSGERFSRSSMWSAQTMRGAMIFSIALAAGRQHGEALALEGRPRGRRAHVIQERLGVGIARLVGERDRVDDGRMGVLRERPDDLDAGIGGSVGLVDDAERRLAA